MKNINETASVTVLGCTANLTVTETTDDENYISHTILITMEIVGEMRTLCDLLSYSKQSVFSKAGLCSVGLKQTEATQFVEQYFMGVILSATLDDI
jgi:hypothetical protein